MVRFLRNGRPGVEAGSDPFECGSTRTARHALVAWVPVFAPGATATMNHSREMATVMPGTPPFACGMKRTKRLPRREVANRTEAVYCHVLGVAT